MAQESESMHFSDLFSNMLSKWRKKIPPSIVNCIVCIFFPKKELHMAVFVVGWDYYTVEK